eukprot:TRINITY_DN5032_c0_g1_i2.p1 TRINITY_DN5032_c0_g1~~TRINITY_DN5032_c0_g1_i2.p1  ORF type:complete len:528 (+),score=207.20 TRINITY_DN5032_c0_g1_i2:157-1740(+)
MEVIDQLKNFILPYVGHDPLYRSAAVALIAGGLATVALSRNSLKEVPEDPRAASHPVSPASLKIDDIAPVVSNLREAFLLGVTRSYAWRLKQLKALKRMIVEHRAELIAAVQKDLGKQSAQEVFASEINIPLTDIEHTISHLKSWMRPESVRTNIAALPAKSYIQKDPLGLVLIISPWNYPVNLALVPLAGALAAGNTVVVKLSRHSANTGAVLGRLLAEHLDRRAVAIEYEGGAPMITRLLEEKWDHIFFTGSVSVGKVVHQAAAKNLTPVTLELGGKNPCIVDKDVDIELAARRIAWGKFFNCGQTCVGVDYVLVHQEVEQKFLDAFVRNIQAFYGADARASTSYNRIISKQATQRLSKLISQGELVYGGKVDVDAQYVEPTVIRRPRLDSELMTDEIFGPILPVHAVASVDAAIEFVNARPHALALYFFSRDSAQQERVLARTRSGAAVCNDTVLHFTNADLPFGGVGDSGLGAYHGRLTFDTFSHRRAVIKSTTHRWFDLPLRYPPYSDAIGWLVDKVTRTGW